MVYSSLLHEIVSYGAFAALAAAILILLILFILLKRDVQRKLQAMSKTVRKAEDECQRALSAMETRTRSTSTEPAIEAPAIKPVEQLVPAAAPRVEERRLQPHELRNKVIDMSTAGLDAPQIAASLRIRENEVRLMLKVHNALRSCFTPN